MFLLQALKAVCMLKQTYYAQHIPFKIFRTRRQKDFRRASNCARQTWSVGRRNSLRQLRAACVSRDAALRAISQPELPACFLPWMAGPCTLPWSSMVAVPSWQCCAPCLPVFPNLQVSSASNAKVTEFPKSLRIRQELKIREGLQNK